MKGFSKYIKEEASLKSRKDVNKIYRKYAVNEELSRDHQMSMDMFNKVVAAFKQAAEVDATSLGLISDMLRYISKFIEEHNQVKSSANLKAAKEAVRKAMNLLDDAVVKFSGKEEDEVPTEEDLPDVNTEEMDTPEDAPAPEGEESDPMKPMDPSKDLKDLGIK